VLDIHAEKLDLQPIRPDETAAAEVEKWEGKHKQIIGKMIFFWSPEYASGFNPHAFS
jgi:hypothetical protein